MLSASGRRVSRAETERVEPEGDGRREGGRREGVLRRLASRFISPDVVVGGGGRVPRPMPGGRRGAPRVCRGAGAGPFGGQLRCVRSAADGRVQRRDGEQDVARRGGGAGGVERVVQAAGVHYGRGGANVMDGRIVPR